MFNDLCEEQGEESYLINQDETRNNVGKTAKGQVVKMVDMAKAKALEFFGDDEAAQRLTKRYL